MVGRNEASEWSILKTKNGDLCNQINVDHFSDPSLVEQANFVNWTFLEPLMEYKLPLLLKSLSIENIPEILCVSEETAFEGRY